MRNKVSVVGMAGRVAAAMLLGACAPRAVTPAPTVDYYRAHSDEREAQMRACAADPGALAKTAECVNALQAANLEKHDSLRDLPPMNIPTEKTPEKPGSESKP